MENNVTTLETANKLKAAGFPQVTALYFSTLHGENRLTVTDEYTPTALDIAAPTAQEIADNLAQPITIILHTGTWNATDEDKHIGQGKTIAEALAQLWLVNRES